MILQNGDVIYLDTDHWETVGRKFKVLSVRERENSTAVELVLEDELYGSIYKCVVPEQQIVRDTDEVDHL